MSKKDSTITQQVMEKGREGDEEVEGVEGVERS
jgi:hypothetical protein